ncbi:ABC transporter permease [Synechococcus sp. PCC 6312]|uniref:ABC transporter permease n=1 Tax=Synechococcus sp. (strain ATCC 27167 / PCC 6312) TaxID=195253 RepID=UPI00029F0FA6|nr:ABC transporter permease [Synechococcus sp. PCC 6312]AFY62744.1 ABC-type dipeptide/oligopeptide/nickel transport system, permease component [Synechococcus sp. PCC 6312]
MQAWQRLRSNPLAKLGAIVLLSFYLLALGADFMAPYDPYSSQAEGALLPPTQLYWRNAQGQFIGPHVYPTTLGPVSLDTGERPLRVNRQAPSPVRLFVQGFEYRFLQISLPWPTQWNFADPKIESRVMIPGIPSRLHLFGTTGPGTLNLLGTDEQARDQLSRLLFGARISLSIGLVGVAVAFPLGMLVGGISGYFGGWWDVGLMRIVEVLMTIPTIYLLVALAAVLPAGLSSAERFLLIVLITSFVSWAGLARVIRGQVLSLKSQTYVQAAVAMGGRSLYIILRHILPQTTTYVIIAATLAIPNFIVAESVLSLIGLGIQQPDPSWGNMLSLATNASILLLQPWLIWPPAVLIVLTVLSFNVVGDSLRDALDPKNTNS